MAAEAQFSPFAWKKHELIFVAAVLLVVWIISAFQIRIGQMKTRDAQRKADTGLVASALRQYLGDHQVLPPAEAGLMVSCGSWAAFPCDWGGGPVADAEGVTYLKKIPKDPLTSQGRTYVYEVDATRQHFRIYAVLEYQRDPDSTSNLTTSCGGDLQCNWYVGN